MNAAYWSEYWKIKGKFVTLDGPKIANKIDLSSIDSSTRPKNEPHKEKKVATDNICSKVEGICDKDTTCKFLGQCVFTISAVKGNKKLVKALSGRHNAIGQVLTILKEHNPKPMRSYYFPQIKKK